MRPDHAASRDTGSSLKLGRRAIPLPHADSLQGRPFGGIEKGRSPRNRTPKDCFTVRCGSMCVNLMQCLIPAQSASDWFVVTTCRFETPCAE
jgi:hypothetical protein